MTEKVSVYIATTHGPVRIERILQEPVPLSEVFVGRSIEPVPEISTEYDNFVRPGRPVDKAFGPFTNASFRMDLSKEIKAGRSWQLATFVAHGLQIQGKLAGPDDLYQRVIVLTGVVNADFKIEEVGHISEKLEALEKLATETRSAGKDLQMIVPKDEVFTSKHGINPIGMSDAKTAFDFCCGGQALPPFPKKRVNIPNSLIFLLTILVGGASVYVFHYNTETIPAETVKETKAVAKEDKIAAPIKVFERRVPEGKTCASVRFSSVDAVLIPVKTAAQPGLGNILADSRAYLLCGLQFSFDTFHPKNPAKAQLTVESGNFVNQQAAITVRNFKGKLTWSIDLPDFPSQVFRYKLSLKAKKYGYEVSHRVLP